MPLTLSLRARPPAPAAAPSGFAWPGRPHGVATEPKDPGGLYARIERARRISQDRRAKRLARSQQTGADERAPGEAPPRSTRT